ncbi:DHS-like NAD/FAD-binding domain-containing protein [Suillus bovinus]|uniref:DHS-like NAD/FAD-binding domain-containing protein n=1 Tax=Suillus bovinus TaxID=48563 RepID=UPI001B866AEB|nr:DHS-like NAD/FAD-binding domain-containing protein [Suillus bovinus]KAG2157909.1 DHS-like NAD/FAD-binding domain-containing protein [Suillus bovinus]
MTLFVPLEASSPPPPTPSFLVPSKTPNLHLRKAIKAILKAKRLVVVCGAGISVSAGIPDFRSESGLFQTLKRDNPKEALSSGRDLFDASVFNNEHTTSMFCQMIAQLSELSQAASPTPFHQALRSLDDRGRLLRVYTQNIDAIELKSGLSFGIPEFDKRRARPRSKPKSTGPPIADQPAISTSAPCSQDSSSITPGSRYMSPAVEVPRCIPLHGTLQTLHCQTCMHTFPLENYVSSLTSGTPPYCPECTQMEETRQLVGKRARGVGKLRPSVVLYNELHKDGEGVGEIARRDLVGCSKGKGRSGVDTLLVVGTSLKVPGTKRMVREFSKAVRARGYTASRDSTFASTGLATPAPSPGKGSATSSDDSPFKSIYLNFDFPGPTREWEGVFDAWLQGDAQSFAELLKEEIAKEADKKEAASERKRKREEDATHLEGSDEAGLPKKKTVKTENPSSERPTSRRKPKASPSVRPRKSKSKRQENTDISVPSAPKITLGSSKLTIRIPPLKGRYIPEVCITTPVPRGPKAAQFPYTPPATHMKHRVTSLLPHSDYPPSDTTEIGYDESDLSELSGDEVAGELPRTAIRTAQYGLRAMGG